MDKEKICAAYQKVMRQAYPRVVVKPCTTDWNPYRDECYHAFFVPDSAAGADYYDNWNREGGWYDQLEAAGFPDVTLMQVYDSQVREHYPEMLTEAVKASAKTKKTKPTVKTSRAPRIQAPSTSAKR